MRYTREQYLELMTFGRVERPMFVELFGPLIGLEDEWRAQGATPEELNLTAFEWDFVPMVRCGANAGVHGGLTPVTLSETEELLVQRDYLGRTVQLCKATATLPLPLDFPVKCMDDWLKLKPMFVYHPDRLDDKLIAAAQKARAAGAVIRLDIPGGFDTPRELMGEEIACMAYYDQPELMADIIQTICDTSVRVFEEVSRKVTIDQISVHEDFAGRSGPLIGPQTLTDFMAPYFKKVWNLAQNQGARIFQMDTDGNVNPVMDAILAADLTCVYPMEPAAGMDIVALRKQYGKRLAMLGGIDKHVLRQGKAEVRKESTLR